MSKYPIAGSKESVLEFFILLYIPNSRKRLIVRGWVTKIMLAPEFKKPENIDESVSLLSTFSPL